MPRIHFAADGTQNVAGLEAKTDAGYMVMAYSGTLGGGTLRLWCKLEDLAAVPVPDSKLSAATVDANGDTVKMISFSAAGTIFVELSGSTAPNVDVVVR